jgi:hypothetical protein
MNKKRRTQKRVLSLRGIEAGLRVTAKTKEKSIGRELMDLIIDVLRESSFWKGE